MVDSRVRGNWPAAVMPRFKKGRWIVAIGFDAHGAGQLRGVVNGHSNQVIHTKFLRWEIIFPGFFHEVGTDLGRQRGEGKQCEQKDSHELKPSSRKERQVRKETNSCGGEAGVSLHFSIGSA